MQDGLASLKNNCKPKENFKQTRIAQAPPEQKSAAGKATEQHAEPSESKKISTTRRTKISTPSSQNWGNLIPKHSSSPKRPSSNRNGNYSKTGCNSSLLIGSTSCENAPQKKTMDTIQKLKTKNLRKIQKQPTKKWRKKQNGKPTRKWKTNQPK
jgi:hypothetical protein